MSWIKKAMENYIPKEKVQLTPYEPAYKPMEGDEINIIHGFIDPRIKKGQLISLNSDHGVKDYYFGVAMVDNTTLFNVHTSKPAFEEEYWVLTFEEDISRASSLWRCSGESVFYDEGVITKS